MSSSNGSFHLESPAFADGAMIPAIHSADGLDLSPPLRWSGAPPHTQSFALIVEDPDAPGGTWVHWVLFNIPGEVHGLPAGLDRSPELANGARHGGCWGVDQCSHSQPSMPPWISSQP
jgi:Raf kinase inhibitor-like YbhB/YbcL family protein